MIWPTGGRPRAPDREQLVIVRKKGDWLAAKVGDELVMMSAESGNYIGLSEVGARVWELIETPKDIDAVCAALQREFEVEPEVCRAEVESFVGELVKHNAIALDPPAA
jgi:hypothetical protein